MTKAAGDRALSFLRRAWTRARLHGAELLARVTPERRCEHGLRLLDAKPHRALRVCAGALAGSAAITLLIGGGLWWRLSTGPLSIDILTPWITAALEQRFGGRHHIEIGGTQIERDEEGRAAVRIRDITVRDEAGVVVASAPKAEVGIAGIDLSGDLRPERLSLLGAEMAVRIEPNGELSIFAGPGADRGVTGSIGPAARGPAASRLDPPLAPIPAPTVTVHGPDFVSTLTSWVQSLEGVGLDGRDLVEIGLKNGTITVDDRRNDRQLTFNKINLSLSRRGDGGAALALSSVGSDGPWSVNATVTPRSDGVRVFEATVRDVSPKDIVLALRVDSGDMQADVPLSAELRAEVGADGVLQSAEGRVLAGAGYVGDSQDPKGRMLIDEGQMHLRWDPVRRTVAAPIEIQAGANRFALVGQAEAPAEPGGVWVFGIAQGTLQLAKAEAGGDGPLLFDRVAARAIYDPAARQLRLERADLRGASGAVSMSGGLDFGLADPVLRFAAAGKGLSTTAFKRLWPAVVTPELRVWVDENVLAGQVERISIALNAPVSTLKASGPPMPDGALAIELTGKNATLRPVPGLSPVREADLAATITGKSAIVTFTRGIVETTPGRRLSLSGGSFEVPSLATEGLPSRAKFRMDGAVEAAAELLSQGPLREAAALPFDAASARGQVAAQVSLALPLKSAGAQKAVRYAVEADLSNFSAERFVRGQKADAGQLRVSATERGSFIKGDLKIAGAPASVEFRKAHAEPDAEVRLQATLDDGARTRLGFDLGAGLAGPIPVKLAGRMKLAERDSRFAVEADLTGAKITEPFPGWSKAAGRAARATFTVVEKGPGGTRIEDIVLEGSGTSFKGLAELGPEGELVHASFPVFALSDGDKASVRVDRGTDGALKVVVRGDLFDGRAFVKTAVAGRKGDRARESVQDLDLEVKVGALTGHHGEALRSVDLRASRRGGKIRSFSLNGKVGRDGKIAGDLRGRNSGRDLINIEASDAGAVFRFTDTYPRLLGGALSIAMDPPTTDQAPQEGLLNIRNFSVREEPALDRVASSNVGGGEAGERTVRSVSGAGAGVSFSRLRLEFTRSPGRLAIREGVVWGAAIGATMDGVLDYFRDEVRLRGTFVPAYALNNIFGRLPIVGTLLGGSNEGLLGITYQVIGSPQQPVLQVNPMSAVAPGFLRKLFEFRGADEQSSARAADDFRPPAEVR